MKKSSFAAMISGNRKRGAFRSRHVYGSYPGVGGFQTRACLRKCWSGAGFDYSAYMEKNGA